MSVGKILSLMDRDSAGNKTESKAIMGLLPLLSSQFSLEHDIISTLTSQGVP